MSKGAIAKVTSTIATVVKVSASMKLVNITPQHSPHTHSAQPPSSSSPHSACPRIRSNATTTPSPLNKLRQNVTSNDRAASRCRVTTPAVLHSNATSTISATARECVSHGRRTEPLTSEASTAGRALSKLEPALGGG